ncbi:MAG: Na+/H+ antiporter subunit E [Desulfurococcaceae archaeon]
MRLAKAAVISVLSFITYIVFSGSISPYDIISGLVVSVITGSLFANISVKNPVKVVDVKRWLWLIIYVLRYFIIDETKAHVDVIRRILHPETPVKPAIVEVPYHVESDYAITTVANSITNTPGTVVVDIDENKKVFYIHWIYAKELEPEKAREEISSVFEKHAKRIFD